MTDDGEAPALTQDEAQRIGESRLLEVLAGGGKIRRSKKCQGCGENNIFEFDEMDPELMVKVLKFFDDQKKGEAKTDAARKAQLLLKEIGEMSSEELAELVLTLEAE